ncbi:DUF6879 family protein [Kitasatospora sp. NPDC001527]|uniref:DUF6879 family protein n=1 Tax=Kitasatospora sp. NPDC001527 TaxID=3154519 RepID=UPI00331B0C25
MTLRFVAKDPNSPDGESPTIWVDESTADLVIQGWKVDESTAAECRRAGSIPEHEAVGRGVAIRRARIVSEPVSDYIRYEYDVTFPNVVAGEQVRWLPRRRASDLALPGNDFWLFDDKLVRWGYFSGDGDSLGGELTEDEAAVQLCRGAFEAVWTRSVPHDDYRV